MINKLVRLTKAKMSCFLCKDAVSDDQMKQIVADFSDNSEVPSKNELEDARKALQDLFETAVTKDVKDLLNRFIKLSELVDLDGRMRKLSQFWRFKTFSEVTAERDQLKKWLSDVQAQFETVSEL